MTSNTITMRLVRSLWVGPAAAILGLLVLASPVPGLAALDLSRASVERLENGLTLIVLEERLLPVVSVQMLYRAGARDEPAGLTGLAHYLEHMAFRATENFPGTEVVSAIYAAGGEWHGYTWIDQTTYFETLPGEHLDLGLRIEADRMRRLIIAANEVEIERGAVLAELHGYDNDPASVLHDAVLYTALQAHPYRNNTIGWETDVRHIRRDDLVAFYRRHYHPANAVLAVVGDVVTADVRAAVRRLFAEIPAGAVTPLPHTIEPPQFGERRLSLRGASEHNHFVIAYHAPAVSSPDYPAFLILQELLGGSAGINFLQDNSRSPVKDGSLLATVADGASTWFPPSAQPYVATIAGEVAADTLAVSIEAAVETRIAQLRETVIAPEALQSARARVLEELIFDVETTEDAAHQLAFFAGLDALDTLLGLPEALGRVTPADVLDVAARYLQPHQRTVGWFTPGSSPAANTRAAHAAAPTAPVARNPPASLSRETSVAAPELHRLRSGLPVIIQRVPLSPASHIRVVTLSTGVELPGDFSADDPVWGHASLNIRALPSKLAESLATARESLNRATPVTPGSLSEDDPVQRLEQAFREVLGAASEPIMTNPAPALLVAVGDLDPRRTLQQTEKFFGDLRPASRSAQPALRLQRDGLVVNLKRPKAQAQLGYAVVAPGPREPAAVPWRLLLYTLTHGYEGRLGVEAITRRGLVYYIDGRYRSDGERAWISLGMGVDPGNLGAMRSILRQELERLRKEPPSDAEIAEAKAHWLGRLRTAAQSNAEISAALAENWIWHGSADAPAALIRRIGDTRREDVLAVVPAFTQGAIVDVLVQ